MDRIILHSDLNCFYASVEMLYNPKYKNVPLAVCGDIEERHGIILTKNAIAKKHNIKTGEAIWQARQKCPDLVCVKANFSLYLRYAKKVKQIYLDYSDRVESFGIDEAWIDVSDCRQLYSSPLAIATIIKNRIKFELGLTVSIGISHNKVYAKLASDLASVDSVYTIFKEESKQKVFPLPISNLLFIGHSNKKKCNLHGIYTIGDLASTPSDLLEKIFGKVGLILYAFANGLDTSEVAHFQNCNNLKSIGNSTTCPKDLCNLNEVRIIFTILSESVCARTREQGVYGKTVTISIRDNELHTITRQMQLDCPTDCSDDVINHAMLLFKKHYSFTKPVRSLGVRLSSFTSVEPANQIDFFQTKKDVTQKQLEVAFDEIRNRFGHFAIQRGCLLQDRQLSKLNPKSDHVIFPESYFK